MPRPKKKETAAAAPVEEAAPKVKKEIVKASLPLPPASPAGDLVTFITWDDFTRVMLKSPAVITGEHWSLGGSWLHEDNPDCLRFYADNKYTGEEDYTFHKNEVKSIKLWRYKVNYQACFISLESEGRIYVFHPMAPALVTDVCTPQEKTFLMQ
jgi:hypothetical protein